MPYLSKVLNQVFTPHSLKKHGIKLNKPTLIRLGWAKSSDHVDKFPVHIDHSIKMSNPCHAITLNMAKKLLKHLIKIDRTSDGYIHSKIGPKYNHFTVYPPIAYELSFTKDAIFRSEIHPKAHYIEKLKRELKELPNGHPDILKLQNIINTEIIIFENHNKKKKTRI